ncbi:hypothetical protein EDC01DRAFT_636161 [Geopyxis carbonaria]|nr:hypothetical protein EDC01DRAFT_636161 [Geopyxis carbonaria]
MHITPPQIPCTTTPIYTSPYGAPLIGYVAILLFGVAGVAVIHLFERCFPRLIAALSGANPGVDGDGDLEWFGESEGELETPDFDWGMGDEASDGESESEYGNETPLRR